MKDWSIEECIRHFESLARKAFTRRVGTYFPGFSWFVENYNHSKYETKSLEDALISAFSKDAYLFGGRKASNLSAFGTKVAVTATSNSGSPVLLANYNRLCGEKCEVFARRSQVTIC